MSWCEITATRRLPLLTVDPAGDDYLRERCDRRDYHVLADARELPTSLAQLYLAACAERRSDLARNRMSPRSSANVDQ